LNYVLYCDNEDSEDNQWWIRQQAFSFRYVLVLEDSSNLRRHCGRIELLYLTNCEHNIGLHKFTNFSLGSLVKERSMLWNLECWLEFNTHIIGWSFTYSCRWEENKHSNLVDFLLGEKDVAIAQGELEPHTLCTCSWGFTVRAQWKS